MPLNELKPTEDAFRPEVHPNCIPCPRCGHTTLPKLQSEIATAVMCQNRKCLWMVERAEMEKLEVLHRGA